MARDIRTYLENYLDSYPGMLEWYTKVESEAEFGYREVLVVQLFNGIRALAILEHDSPIGKLCHVSVVPMYRRLGLGMCLVSKAFDRLIARGSEEIVLTTDWSTYLNYGPFFLGCGFNPVGAFIRKDISGALEVIWKIKFKTAIR